MAESQIAHGPTLAATLAQGVADRVAEGTHVGDYTIERHLGAGAMGDVYAARHPVIGKRAAIKVLKRELSADPESMERFIREARAVNQVDHANVIDVFNIGRLPDGRLYLMMDLVDGRSLRKVLEDGPLAVDAALAILDQIADALDAAHAKGVVHRDLKPDNVMVVETTPPKVFVLDFGIAKLVAEGQGGNTLTGKGAWLGTPGYMAPEQWSADGAGPASDRYALGVMAYELLSGALPFKAPTLPQMMEQHFRAPVPALATKRGKVAHSATLDPVLARAMAKTPDARFASAKQLVQALRDASGGKVVVRGKRSPMVPAIAGAGVLAVVIGGYAFVRGGGEKETPDPRAAGQSANDETIAVEVVSVPAGAKVMRDGRYVGPTPLTLHVRPGTKLSLAVAKPGYQTAFDELTPSAPTTRTKQLVEITAFQGVWALPDAQLRGFKRVGDRVDVYRHSAVRDSGEWWRTFAFEDAEGDDVVFAADVELALGGLRDPTCQVVHRVEYRFEPADERLEVRAEKVTWNRRGEQCLVQGKQPGEAILLSRADREGDTRESQPPVGVPENKANNVKRPPVDAKLEAKLRAEARRREEEKKQAALKEPPRNNSVQEPKNALGNEEQQTNAPVQTKLAPQTKQATEPKQAPVQPQQRRNDDSQQANPPRGDSQQGANPPPN